MNRLKRYCFEAEEKKFKKIIAHNAPQVYLVRDFTDELT
jgi:hypothetical protein